MFEFLNRLPQGKYDIVKSTIEDEGEKYLKKIYTIKNNFYMSFFEECINSTTPDAYEYFVELKANGNVFGESVYTLTRERGRRFIKLMAIHHSIKMLRFKECGLSLVNMKNNLVYAFDLNDHEQKVFDLLYACFMMYSGSFSELFASAVMKYLFGKDNYGKYTIAFI